MERIWLLLMLVFPALAQVKITYLANEGVLIESPAAKILIDALFRDSLADYLRHDSATQQRLETGKPPFDRVSLVLATHYHLDHWDAGAISRFLRLNPAAVYASTPQATGMMPHAVRDRTRALSGGAISVAGAQVEALPLQHATTDNLAFRITTGGRTVIHLGDAETVPRNFDALTTYPPPDVLLAPFWWLLDERSRTFLSTRWKPRNVVAIHFGERDTSISAPKLRTAHPEAWLCLKPFDSRSF